MFDLITLLYLCIHSSVEHIYVCLFGLFKSFKNTNYIREEKKLTFVEEKEQDFLFEFFRRFIQGISSVECIVYGYKTLW